MYTVHSHDVACSELTPFLTVPPRVPARLPSIPSRLFIFLPQIDVFSAASPTSLGTLQQVSIGYAEKTSTALGKMGAMVGNSWLLSSVEVLDMATGLNTVFEHHGWIDKSKKRVTLAPVSQVRALTENGNVDLSVSHKKDVTRLRADLSEARERALWCTGI